MEKEWNPDEYCSTNFICDYSSACIFNMLSIYCCIFDWSVKEDDQIGKEIGNERPTTTSFSSNYVSRMPKSIHLKWLIALAFHMMMIYKNEDHYHLIVCICVSVYIFVFIIVGTKFILNFSFCVCLLAHTSAYFSKQWKRSKH